LSTGNLPSLAYLLGDCHQIDFKGMHEYNQEQFTVIDGADAPLDFTKEFFLAFSCVMFLEDMNMRERFLKIIFVGNLFYHTNKMPADNTANTFLLRNFGAGDYLAFMVSGSKIFKQ